MKQKRRITFQSKESLAIQAQNALEQWHASQSVPKNGKEKFQVLDFFCGCGGMSLGFAALGLITDSFRVVGGCDMDKESAETFAHNFGVQALCEDVRSLVDKAALSRFLSRLTTYDNKKPLIVIGCAPCQGFTSHRKKRWDLEDERNTLIESFAKIAVKLNPACVIMENVPEMLSHKYWNHFKAAQRTLLRAGYIVHQTIYNAASFGVPQDRFRSLVIAMREHFSLPEPLLDQPKIFTVRTAIGHLPPVTPGEAHKDDPMHRSASHRESTLQTIRAVPKNGGSRPFGIGPKCLDRIKGFSDVYGRLNWDQPAITITHYARNPASGRYVHPEQDRGLTIREAALLQSFPAGFDFVGSFDSIFRQIGEAVPPKFACAVAASVFVDLTTPNIHQSLKGVRSITEPVSSSFSSVIAGLKMERRRK